MDASALRSLSDDDLREKLEEHGYKPPPITDGAVREIMRRKLFKYLNPNGKYPEEDELCDAESEVDEDGVVVVRGGKRFGAGDTPSASKSRVSYNNSSETAQRSSFPVFVAACLIVMNISLAVCIFYRDWLF
ncbi:unnamed protein product [Rodentolepis nana]|uniref:LEM domain-containing protein n=1 Tax=Rodentolepis nana TaxID=102285 RepID=A0A0R3T6K4_RODNA|nr:unnamed protein product [Rodentolepis nana]